MHKIVQILMHKIVLITLSIVYLCSQSSGETYSYNDHEIKDGARK